MVERVSTMDIRQKLGDLLNRVALRHDEFIIERKGKPLAAMVPVEKLEHLERLARLGLLDALAGGGSKLSQGRADALADEAKHGSRRARRR